MLLLWVGGNLLAAQLRLPMIDAPPFNWLQGAASVLALYITVFILSTQRRENELSELREQLNLELVITSEQKTAKVIQLLEELRRDMPQVLNRYDPEATAMAQPANPEVMLEAIKETQEMSPALIDGEGRGVGGGSLDRRCAVLVCDTAPAVSASSRGPLHTQPSRPPGGAGWRRGGTIRRSTRTSAKKPKMP